MRGTRAKEARREAAKKRDAAYSELTLDLKIAKAGAKEKEKLEARKAKAS